MEQQLITKMPLKSITAENFFKFRRLGYEAPFLNTIDLEFTYNLEKAVEKWIDNNLKSRFFLGKCVALTSKNKIEDVIRVGFEDPKELSYFVLACPHLKYK